MTHTPELLRELADRIAAICDSQTHEQQEEQDLSDAVSAIRDFAAHMEADGKVDWHPEAIAFFAQVRRAAEHLPEFVTAHLTVENGAAWVYWSDADGNIINVDGADQTLAEQFSEAIDAAMQADAKEKTT